MDKNRKTSHILNVFQYDADGHVVLPASLTLSIAPGASDNNSKVPTTAWVRTYVSGLSYQGAITLTTSGTSGAATLVGNTLNIPTYTLAGLGGQPALNGTGFVKISGTTISYDNNTYATQTYVGTQIANLVASAPATLDTLNELATALGNDPNFATTVATSIGTKQAQLNGTGFVKVIGTTVSYDNSTYLTTSSAASTYQTILTNPITGTGTTQTLAKFTSTGSTIGDSNVVLSSGANFVEMTVGSTSGSVNNYNTLSLLAVTEPRIYLTASDGFNSVLFNSYGNIGFQAQFSNPSVNNFIFYYNGYSSTNKSLVFQTSGLDRLTLNQNGSVRLNNYTTNGFVKFSGSDGTLIVDTNTYLTTSSASSTYLPLAGGTLTGTLNGTTASFSGTITTANGSGTSINITTNGNNGTSSSPLQTNINFYGYNGNLNGQIRVDDISGSSQIGTMKFYTWNSTQVLALTIAHTGIATFANTVIASSYNASTQGLNVSEYGFLSQTLSGQMTILGHNVRASNSVNNQVNVVNGGWISSMIKQYYNDGITFHTSNSMYSGNAIYPIAETERLRITSTGNILIGTTNADVGGSVAGTVIRQNGTMAICFNDTTPANYSSPIVADRRNTAGDGLMYGMWRQGIFQAGIGATNGQVMTFITGDGFNSIQTERMRITGANINIGSATAASYGLLGSSNLSSSMGITFHNGSTYSKVGGVISVQESAGSHALELWVRSGGNEGYAVRVTSGGFVGIGIQNPVHKLDVVGLSSDKISARIRNTDQNGNAALVINPEGNTGISNGDATVFFDCASTAWVTGVDKSDSSKYKIANDPYGDFRGNNYLTIQTNGNIGIGTTSPSYKLEISGSTTTELRIIDSGDVGFQMVSGGTNNAFSIRTNGSTVVMSTQNSRSLSIGVNSSSGDVVGSTTGLSIVSGGAATFASTVTTSDVLYVGSGGTGATITWGGSLSYIYSPSSKALSLSIGGVTTTGIYINTSGLVGIGTTSPSNRLQVSGNIYSTDTVFGRNLKPEAFVSVAAGSPSGATIPLGYSTINISSPCDNNWRSILTNINDTKAYFWVTLGDAASKDTANYFMSMTSPAYGVSSFGAVSYSDNGWNTGGFEFTYDNLGNGTHRLLVRCTSYYNSANTAYGTIYFLRLE